MKGYSETQQREKDVIIRICPCNASFHEGLWLNLIKILTNEILSNELMLQDALFVHHENIN